MTTETNLQRHTREMAESQARLRAETATDSMLEAMATAAAPTKAELDRLAAADQAVSEAEAAVNATGLALNRAERGSKPTLPDPDRRFSFFERKRETYVAAAAAAVGDLRIDHEEARSQLQSAIRRRNAVRHEVDAAKRERRQAAKRKHTPPRVPVQSRGDRFTSKEAA